MHRISKISIVILTVLHLTQAEFDCQYTTCSCDQSPNRGYSIECPDFIQPQVQINFYLEESKEFEVDCRKNDNYVDYLPKRYLPPEFDHLQLDFLSFKTCTLHKNVTMKNIMQELHIESTKKLRIIRSKVDDIVREQFHGMEGIETLEVIDNNIKNLPDDLIYDLSNLTEIDLARNKIVIPQAFFKNSKNLKFIELAENNLPDNITGMFDGLENLIRLNMWDMEIEHLPPNVFDSLHNLAFLDLSLNKIRSILKDTFYGLKNLKALSLRRNNMRDLPEGLFHNNTQLEEIRLEENLYLSELPPFLLSNFPQLSRVSLQTCNLSTLPENIFWGSDKIATLDLSNNILDMLPKEVFRDLKELKHLDLENNQLMHIHDELFKNLKKLEKLNLNYNYIILTENAFQGLTNLRTFSIQYNELTRVYKKMFSSMKKLEELDLSHNELTLKEDSRDELLGIWSPMSDLVELKELILSHNNISDMFADWRITKTKLQMLDLSYNKFTQLVYNDLRFLQLRIEVNLENNEIVNINMNQAEQSLQIEPEVYSMYNRKHIVVRLNNNTLHCSCNLYNLYRYFDLSMNPEVHAILELKANNLLCATPPSMTGKKVKDIESKTYICAASEYFKPDVPICPIDRPCYIKPFNKLFTIDFSNAGLKEVPVLSDKFAEYDITRVEVILRGNNLTELPKRNMNYDQVTSLDLSYNNISHIGDWLPPNLEKLLLNNNNIRYLNQFELDLVNSSKLESITLYDNSWACDCDTVPFLKFLQNNYKTVNNIHKNIICKDRKEELASLTPEQLCPLPKEIIILICLMVMFVCVIVTALSIFYYNYKLEIKVWLYAHQQCLWFVTEEELDKDKLYDAFISYSHKDEDFVISELISNLEQGPRPFKLCLHFRNWQPGEFITANIANSVADSRRTVVILSENFLASEWGKMEFRTAHIQALNEGRARVIMVILGEIPVDKLDDELKAYLNTNTYIKWGDPWFWDKLRYAMPHTPKFMKHNYQQTLEKIKIFDDKLDLIHEPTTPPIGTTPPADKVTFDPMIKDGALNVTLINGALVNCNLINGKLDDKFNR